jgi:hypothetical protein
MFQVTPRTTIAKTDITLDATQQVNLAYELSAYLRCYVYNYYTPSTHGLRDLYGEDLVRVLDLSQLTTKEGKLTKRLSKLIKTMGYELTQEELSRIGAIIAHHAIGEFTYDITDQFNWSAGDFGDGGSCFWGDRREAKGMMMDAGGLALRFFDDDGQGNARCWVMPYKDTWICFNAYGCSLELVKTRLSFIYPTYHTKFIKLSNYHETAGTLYINRELGMLVTEKVSTWGKVSMEVGEEGGRYRCDDCNERIPAGDEVYIERRGTYICEDCYHSDYSTCEGCEHIYRYDDMNNFDIRVRRGGIWLERECYRCDNCQSEDFNSCDDCEFYIPVNEDLTETVDGNSVCGCCIEDRYSHCEECESYYKNGEGCCQVDEEEEGQGLTYRQLIAKLQGMGMYDQRRESRYKDTLRLAKREGLMVVVEESSLWTYALTRDYPMPTGYLEVA